MPPKKVDKKAVEKQQKKIIDDKTFGLKNKNKSKKVQQYVAQVSQQVKTRGKSARQLAIEQTDKDARKSAKQQEEAMKDEIGSLFKAVAVVKQQEVAADVDPKSVICAFFKAGSCKRGNKCKYSHDVEQTRKTAKINLYNDPRNQKPGDEDTMENWDQATLEDVVAQKYVKKPTETEIVCKYFLDAVERRLYGWRWQCPNGDTCHYRHALPPGFVLKSQQEKKEDKEDHVDIGEEIEEERRQLNFSKCTPVTLDSFMKWKEEQKKKKAAVIEEKAQAAAKKGRTDGLSGRALFTFDPSLFVDDADAEQEYEIATPEFDEKEEDAAAEAAEEDDKPLYPEDLDNTEDIQHDSDKEDQPNQGAKANVQDASLFLDDEDLPDD